MRCGIISALKDKLKQKVLTRRTNVLTKKENINTRNKETCPHCGKEFIDLEMHLQKCKKNPNNAEKEVKPQFDFIKTVPITDDEAKNFFRDVNDIVMSNMVRLTTARATGKLNSLNGIVQFMKLIKKRGGFL